ncbi:hypothetical protein ACEV76_17630 [Vibrio parahaemolyticus]|uniref:hypothetical protein n=1 Tax=Vibrio TaxID=662 RepID=UPI000A35F747|nr:hypothetical protein [Vibrio parahaemolyticus]OUJ63496.1 hypothetical protein BTO03_00010 [Vibrio parahaemolyticus]TOA42458.1 hypothetical protein CGK28_00010 [Vibrio parahaemolyticus]HCH6177429.1 hypothetical protein [Vibrio parahaemolyticus]
MKTVLTTMLIGSLISAPIFAQDMVKDNATEGSHNQHHGSESNTSPSAEMPMMDMMQNMENHQQMMTQVHAMMTEMHQMMSEKGCDKAMGKNMMEKES